uniref:Unkempt zinc finger domain-containing protein n=1 Tax=Glossina morsitans morsitans TaxID=37546 RepID=A0A1B0G3C0_GLOMM
MAPLLLVPESDKLSHAQLPTILGALTELYVPIQYREDLRDKSQRIFNLSLTISNFKADMHVILPFVLAYVYVSALLTPKVVCDNNYVPANYKSEPCKRPPHLRRQSYAYAQYHNSEGVPSV